MSKWEVKKLGDISDMCLGKMLDKEKNQGDYQPYLANINVRWGGFDLENLQEMRFEEKEEKRYGLKYGDLIVCEGGEPGRCAVWKDELPKMKIQKALHRVRMHSGYNTFFVYYRLLLAGRTGEINKHFIGSTIKHLTGIGLKQVEFEYPKLETQNAIAKVLSTIDQKTGINNRINAELEAMAKTLYDYWFVQFDFPDESGKPYKSSGGKMVYNAELKREIPVGWEVRSLSNVFPISNEALTPSLESKKWFKYYSIPLFDSSGSYVLEQGKNISSNKFIVNQRTLLVSKLNPWFSRVVFPPQEDDLICSTEFVVLQVSGNESKSFLYLMVKNQEFISYCINAASGTSNSHKRVNPKVMGWYKFPFHHKHIKMFGEKVYPLIAKTQKNRDENQRLAALRDWLLPMLMNGQVRVESANKEQSCTQ